MQPDDTDCERRYAHSASKHQKDRSCCLAPNRNARATKRPPPKTARAHIRPVRSSSPLGLSAAYLLDALAAARSHFFEMCQLIDTLPASERQRRRRPIHRISGSHGAPNHRRIGAFAAIIVCTFWPFASFFVAHEPVKPPKAQPALSVGAALAAGRFSTQRRSECCPNSCRCD